MPANLNSTSISDPPILLPICSLNITTNCTQPDLTRAVGFNAFLYICAVLVFYALSMVCLMVKYIRREKEDAVLEQYYLDFVKRETFHSHNRHKYYSEVFKKFLKKGKNKPLSTVYNETDLYARRSIPPGSHVWENRMRQKDLWHDEGISESSRALTDISEETVRLTVVAMEEGSDSVKYVTVIAENNNERNRGKVKRKDIGDDDTTAHDDNVIAEVHYENETRNMECENDSETRRLGPNRCRSS